MKTHTVFLRQGLEVAEVRAVLPRLPVTAGAAAKVTALVEAAEPD